MRRAFMVMAAVLGLSATAHARTSEPVFDRHNPVGGYAIQPVQNVAGVKQMRRKHLRRQYRDKVSRHYARQRIEGRTSREAQLLPHPVGCPSRAFCGCGAALEVFGRHVRELWLARNWFQFPSASPAPGNVAVRRGHVFVIREVRGPGRVLAYDANSGGHKTRLHERSLAGYRVVNPRGSRYAAAS